MLPIFMKLWRCHRLQYCVCFLLMASPLCAVSLSLSPAPLSLAESTQRALANNPELEVFQWRFQLIEGMRHSAQLRPAYVLGIDAENVAGSGDFSGAAGAELTLSLSSVIELGGKRGSRVSVAASRYALAQAELQAKSLDLLGRVTQGFIAALALQEKLEVAKAATQLAEQSYRLVKNRVQRGAAPEAERLRAEVLLRQVKIQQEALVADLASRKFALASLWKGDRADFDRINGNLFKFDQLSSFEALYGRVAASPAIQVFASEERVRDAELTLARSQSSSNVRWSFGLRRHQGRGDSALTAALSVPMFAGRRNRGEVQTALAEREMTRYQREATLLAIRSRLFEAWQTYQQSAAAAEQMRKEVLPALENAVEQTRQAYERGRYSYVDWVTAQRDLLDAQMAAIDAASTALLNQALIEQLTAEPLVARPLLPETQRAKQAAPSSPRQPSLGQ